MSGVVSDRARLARFLSQPASVGIRARGQDNCGAGRQAAAAARRQGREGGGREAVERAGGRSGGGGGEESEDDGYTTRAAREDRVGERRRLDDAPPPDPKGATTWRDRQHASAGLCVPHQIAHPAARARSHPALPPPIHTRQGAQFSAAFLCVILLLWVLMCECVSAVWPRPRRVCARSVSPSLTLTPERFVRDRVAPVVF